jgi:glycosyltransferase involved in cell wall biosynthesis
MSILFSIIIPTRNRLASLDRCLHALRLLDFPADQFEVLVIDDGSSPPVDPLVATHAKALPLRLLTQQNRGPAAARNLGLQNALGDIVVFTDDDCRPSQDWLSAYRAAFQRDPQSAWGGTILPAPENGLYGNASQILVSYLYERLPKEMRFCCTNNLAFPRQQLLNLNGYDETFPLAAGEDREICDRWSKHFSLQQLPGALILHHQQLSFTTFCKQQFRYGRGAFHFQARRQNRGESGLKIARFPFYSGMLQYPWKSHNPVQAATLSLLLAISQIANALGFFYERSR